MRRSRKTIEPPAAPVSTLDAIRGATRLVEQTRVARDRLIGRAHGEYPLRAIAEAASLSVSRVKQLVAAGPSFAGGAGAVLPPVTDVDIFLADYSLQRGDRVLGLDEVDPLLPRWESERAFIAEDSRRRRGPDISTDLYDLDPESRWIVSYAPGTREVYAFQHQTHPHPDHPHRDDAGTGDDPAAGSLSGPCVVLGHLPTEAIVRAAFYSSAATAANRLGGLAWVYGRVRFVNALLKAVADPLGRLVDNGQHIWTYLESLPESERA